MPKRGRRDAGAPIPLAPPPIKSLKRARRIVSAFHANHPSHASVAAASDAEHAAYQEASALSVRRHSTSRWVLRRLRARWPHLLGGAAAAAAKTATGAASSAAASPLPRRCLEVGAINTELLDAGARDGLRVDAIDLRASDPRIRRADFFGLAPAGEYHVVVLSMVLNCVPEPSKRGEMLLACARHLRGRRAPDAPGGGVLFLTLPRRCLEASRRTSADAFRALLGRAGFEVLEERFSPKIAFYILGLAPERADAGADAGGEETAGAAREGARGAARRKGSSRDFAVVLPS